MDNVIKIPNEYLENTSDTNIEDNSIEGDDLNLNYSQNFLDLDNSNEYKMPGEEEISEVPNSNLNVKESKISEPIQGSLPGSIATSNSNDNQIENKVIPQQEEVADNNFNLVLSEIDDKIKNLEQLLSNVSSKPDENLFQSNNLDNSKSYNENTLENNNLENIEKSSNTINNTSQTNNNITQNNKTQQIKNILNEINELRNLRNLYTSNPKSANVINQNLTNNLFKDEGQVLFDNFTPNLKLGDFDNDDNKSEVKEIATKRAVDTERAMGGDPQIVTIPSIGEVVIDKKTQNGAAEAVSQHGGIENAINDSVINQKTFNEINNLNETNSKKDVNLKTYTPNFYSESGDSVANEVNRTNNKIQNDSISNLINESTSVSDNTSNLFQNNNNVENLPNTNLNLVKSSKESLTVLNKISKQLEVISNSINKNFNNLGKSITSVVNNQKNYTNINQSSTNNPSSNSDMGKSSDQSFSEIPEIRGDFPLPDDFPKNFNTQTLFSNIRP